IVVLWIVVGVVFDFVLLLESTIRTIATIAATRTTAPAMIRALFRPPGSSGGGSKGPPGGGGSPGGRSPPGGGGPPGGAPPGGPPAPGGGAPPGGCAAGICRVGSSGPPG